MLAAERKKLIVEYLKQNHIATTQTLCDITGASPATIRRDLTLMEEESLLYCPALIAVLNMLYQSPSNHRRVYSSENNLSY